MTVKTANDRELYRKRELAIEDVAEAQAELAAIEAELAARGLVHSRMAQS